MKLKLALALAFAGLLCQSAFSQAWSGILDPSRATDWTQAGIPGGIPNRTTVCKTVSMLAGSGSDSANSTAIDSAISACAGTNEVVMIPAGTWYVAGINFGGASGVTLRGAGPDQTKILITQVVSCGEHADVCILGSEGWPGSYNGSTAWTAGYAKGTSTITLGSTSGLSVGQIVILDQRDDAIGIASSPAGATESGSTVTITTSIPHGFSVGQSVGIGCVGSSASNCNVTNSGYDGVYTITAVPSGTTFQYTDATAGLSPSGSGQATVDTGGVYQSCVGGPTCSDESGSGMPDIGRECPDNAEGTGSGNGVNQCIPGEISYRDQMEIKQITAINGNQISINPSVEMPNWRASQAPGLWWAGAYAQDDGVENISFDYSNDNAGSYVTGGIVFYNAYECWAKNVRSVDGNRNHVWLQQSARIDVEDSYFFGTKGGHSKSYGVELFDGNSDNLVENNICQHVVSCIMVGGDWGSVFGYNYMVDSGYNVTDWLIGMLNENHDFAGYEMFEGNDADLALLDNIHGSSTALTSFRNRLRGQDTPARSNSMLAADDAAFNRFANFIGNVMGTTGAETSYQATQLFASGYIWNVGAQTDRGGTPNDPLTTATLLRWGNYDVVSDATRWCGDSADPGWPTTCSSASEVPTSSFPYVNGNPVPSGTTLPASLYLSSAPAFWQTAWGTPPWPAIGPDVSNGNAPDGNDPGAADNHSNAIPAQLCYANTPIDQAYQQSLAITGASWSYGTATVTLNNSGTNALEADDTVNVSGVSSSGSGAGFNGTFSVVSATSTSITYALQSNPGSYNSGGTATYPNILLFNAAHCYTAEYSSASLAPPTGLAATVH